MADDGRIFVGCNVENASYSIGCCAERHAIGAAIVAGASKWSRIVVAAPRPVWPCGMCLQALAEFATPDFEIIAVDMQGKAKQRTTLGALLPQAFRLTSTAESD